MAEKKKKRKKGLKCNKLNITVTLKSTQAKYDKYTFNGVGPNFCLNWAEPCNGTIVDEILATCGRTDIRGTDVTQTN